MINRRILASGMSIVTAMALMAGSTFALFSDTAISQNNTFSTATADLQISADDDGNVGGAPVGYGNEIAAPAINELNMTPGFSKTYYFWLKNNSTGVNMNLTATLNDIVNTVNAGMQDNVQVALNCGAAAGPATVTVWNAGEYPVGSLTAGNEVQCAMTVTLGDVDNTFQGSSLRFDGVFKGTQS